MKRTSNSPHRTLNIEGGDRRQTQVSTFDVQCSVSDVCLRTYERPQIRLPPTAEESRLHRRGRAHARARHRGEYRQRSSARRSPGSNSAVAVCFTRNSPLAMRLFACGWLSRQIVSFRLEAGAQL